MNTHKSVFLKKEEEYYVENKYWLTAWRTKPAQEKCG